MYWYKLFTVFGHKLWHRARPYCWSPKVHCHGIDYFSNSMAALSNNQCILGVNIIWSIISIPINNQYLSVGSFCHGKVYQDYAHRMCGSGFTQMFRPWTAHGSTFTGVSPSWTLAITSSLYGLKIIPKSVISLIDALFVFLRYTFFLIYIPAEITWTLYWRFLAFISEYFFENVCDGPTFMCIHRPYFTVIKACQQTCGKVPL